MKGPNDDEVCPNCYVLLDEGFCADCGYLSNDCYCECGLLLIDGHCEECDDPGDEG